MFIIYNDAQKSNNVFNDETLYEDAFKNKNRVGNVQNDTSNDVIDTTTAETNKATGGNDNGITHTNSIVDTNPILIVNSQ
jgi:hypothetical protein